MRSWLASFVIAIFAPSLAMGEVDPSLLGRRVAAIEFETATRLDEATLRTEMPLREGEPLAAERLDGALEWLRAKESFETVEAEAVAGSEGEVVVRIRIQVKPLIVGVSFEGARAVSEEDLRRRSRIRDGEAFESKRVEESRRRIASLYLQRGYPRARVDARLEGVAPGAVKLTFAISEGEPVRLERIAIVVEGPFDERTLREAIPYEDGAVWPTEALGEGEGALRRWLRSRGYYDCDVLSLESIDELRAVPEYRVTVGERSEVVITGNESIDRDRLLGVVDLASRPIVTAGTWREMARRMRVLYQEAGRPFATVRVEISDDEPREVRFFVVEGPAVQVARVRFRGNRRLSDGTLRGTMEMRARSRWPFGSSGTFLEDAFIEDLERIRDRYRAEGFLAARVIDVRFDLDLAASDLGLTLTVWEGERSRLGRLEIRGLDASPEVELSDALRTGQPYEAADVEAERFRLLDRVRSLGRPDARVVTETTIRQDADSRETVDVAFVVTPGPEVRVGRVVVQRNFYTRDEVIRRELDLSPGDLFDPAALLEAQRRIYNLGLFRSASVTAAETDALVRDVHLRVAERAGGELQYGFGFNTSTGVRNFVELAHRNLAGTGRGVSLRGEVNLSKTDFSPDEYLGDLGGRVPRLWGSRWDGRANVVAQHRERDVDEFSIERFAFSTGVEREIVQRLQGTFLLELDDSRIFDVAPDAVLTGQDVGRLRTVTLNPILVFDGRDDAFAPSVGVFESIRLRFAARELGSDVGFVKLTGQHSQYVPVGRGITWVYSLRAGIAEVIEGATSVPLRERFFLGGRTTVRGFDENEIGPRGDEGNPIGGDLSLNVNTELRFPLAFGIDGAAFVDGGGLYLRDQGVAIDDFRMSAGPGLRYRTPIGALAVDYGFKLDRRDGESIGEVHFSIGNPF